MAAHLLWCTLYFPHRLQHFMVIIAVICIVYTDDLSWVNHRLRWRNQKPQSSLALHYRRLLNHKLSCSPQPPVNSSSAAPAMEQNSVIKWDNPDRSLSYGKQRRTGLGHQQLSRVDLLDVSSRPLVWTLFKWQSDCLLKEKKSELTNLSGNVVTFRTKHMGNTAVLTWLLQHCLCTS